VRPNAPPIAAGYRTIVVEANRIMVNAILPLPPILRGRKLLLCHSEAAMKSLLDSRDPSTSEARCRFHFSSTRRHDHV
jgi:hypothetical protein